MKRRLNTEEADRPLHYLAQLFPGAGAAERLAADIGLGTTVTAIARPISFASALSKFRVCDVIFGCTDDEWGRSLPSRFAVIYIYMPDLDTADRTAESLAPQHASSV